MNEHEAISTPHGVAGTRRRAPRPADDAARVRTLESLAVLGTPPQPFSQAVAFAAAAIANTPMAIVSLVASDRLWLHARHGFDLDEIDRDITFCAHTVCGRVPLVVPDATVDPRFADNPMVVGPPFIRFYAGFPLVVAGQPVGALCAIGDLPRTLDADAMARLGRLADGVSAWLRLRDDSPREAHP